MGKLSRNQRAARVEDELAGREPYRAHQPAIPRGKRQYAAAQVATDHPGSKRGRLLRFPALTDKLTGTTRVDWRKFRKAKSRGPAQDSPLGQLEREQGYLRQTGRATLTSAQRRRSGHKMNHAIARSRRS